MKNFKTYLIAFFALAMVSTSCKDNSKKIGLLINHADLKHSKPSEFQLKGVEKSYEIDYKAGSTSSYFSLDSVEMGYYTLEINDVETDLFLKSGYDLALTLKGENVEFSGKKGVEANQYLKQKQADKNALIDEIKADPKAFFSQSETDFEAKMNSFIDKQNQHLSKVPKSYTDFLNLEHQKLDDDEVYMYLIFAINNDFKLEKLEEKGAISKKIEAFEIGNLQMFEYDKNFNNLIAYYLEYGYNTNKYYNLDYFQFLLDYHLPHEMKEETLFQYIMQNISTETIQDEAFLTKLNTFKKKSPKKVKQVEEAVAKVEKLQKGNPSPTFECEDINGEMVALESLKGRFVYIDVWATWCPPCRAELPHLKKLEEEFEPQGNIAFVSLSVDKDKSAWQKMVKEKSLKGIQLIEGTSTFSDEYGITGIPRFILLDREGNIIDADAPRPSDEGTYELLNNLK